MRAGCLRRAPLLVPCRAPSPLDTLVSKGALLLQRRNLQHLGAGSQAPGGQGQLKEYAGEVKLTF